ncbi:MAG: hypothetical protein ACRDJY_04165 [Thermoleophilaceae bacterium]
MYLGRPTLGKVEAFLHGYDQHARRCGRSSLEGWTDWLLARLGRHCSLTWKGIVRQIAAAEASGPIDGRPGEVEEHTIDLMFELLVEYLRETEAARPGR